jgi:hypothetical protein
MRDGLSHLCHTDLRNVARPAGFEPATFGSGGRRSIQLSYGRVPASVSPAALASCPADHPSTRRHVRRVIGATG